MSRMPKVLKNGMRFKFLGRTWELKEPVVWLCDEVNPEGGEINRLVNREQLKSAIYDDKHTFKLEMSELLDD